jgi:PAT family beta-lactamase induction signal transducer AmpG
VTDTNSVSSRETPAPNTRKVWLWLPSLYFTEGIPYVVVMTLSVVMYKNLKVSNTDIALYTSWLYLPWVIKPLWSPFVDLFDTKRFWIVSLQFFIGATLALVALTVPAPNVFRLTLAVFWLMAFSSATHDIAADGFYLLAMPPHDQAAFVGVRSTFYRLAMIAGQGGLVYLAGSLQHTAADVSRSWSLVFFLTASGFGVAGAYHLWALPRPAADQATKRDSLIITSFLAVFTDFFRKKEIGVTLGFLLLYRFAEAQLLKLVAPFLLDARTQGGLGLTNQQMGVAYGTVGAIALTAGGLLGGYAISRGGLQRWLWPMIIAMYAPNVVFILLALTQPGNLFLISGALAVEQFGYGFGFAAYMLYMIAVARGEHQTAHYAICTGFMALGMMLPGMAAGWIEDHLGYPKFFLWVCVATIPSFIATSLIKVDPAFGKRQFYPASDGPDPLSADGPRR